MNTLHRAINNNKDKDFIVFGGITYTYKDMIDKIIFWSGFLYGRNIKQGDVIAVVSSYSPSSIALSLSIIYNNNILLPVNNTNYNKFDGLQDIFKPDFVIELNGLMDCYLTDLTSNTNYLYNDIKESGHPGIILYDYDKDIVNVHDIKEIVELKKDYDNSMILSKYEFFNSIETFKNFLYIIMSGGKIIIK